MSHGGWGGADGLRRVVYWVGRPWEHVLGSQDAGGGDGVWNVGAGHSGMVGQGLVEDGAGGRGAGWETMENGIGLDAGGCSRWRFHGSGFATAFGLSFGIKRLHGIACGCLVKMVAGSFDMEAEVVDMVLH